HFGGSAAAIPGIGQTGYIGLTAFALNALVAVVLTVVLRALGAPAGTDETSPDDYTRDASPSSRARPVAGAGAGAGAGADALTR
ncbi:sodium:solute symporter, partial [Kitasatospora sp. NPDC093558]